MSHEALAIVGPATWSLFAPVFREALVSYGLTYRVDCYGIDRELRLWAGQDPEFQQAPPRGVVVFPESRLLFREYLADPRATTSPHEKAREAAQFLIESVRATAARHPSISWILATAEGMYPGSLDAVADSAADPFSVAVEDFNRLIREAVRGELGLSVFDRRRLGERWGADRLEDPRLDLLARFPASQEGMRLLAERLAAHWAAICGKMKKVLVLDCDNTLWGGIVGEDGLDGIQIGEDGIGRAYVAFQRALLALESRGTILALCSRNNLSDVEDVFRCRRDMVIPRDRIAAAHIGWGPKSDGIRQIAQELGLGLRDFVFIDDNPAEREQVRQAIPEIIVPELPADPADLAAFGYDLGWRYFFKVAVDEEGRSKTDQYRMRAAFAAECTTAPSQDEFYRSLNMKAVIALDSLGLAARSAQLTQKTNQFNLTLCRYTEAELRAMMDDPSYLVCTAALRDRFGEHGWIGLAILKRTEDDTCWFIDTFLISCRVLGRHFEHAFANACIERVRSLRPLPFRAVFNPGPRNAQVSDFLDSMGFQRIAETPDGSREYLLVDSPIASNIDYVKITWESS